MKQKYLSIVKCACIAILIGFTNTFISCSNSNFDKDEAEQVVENFYKYYIQNYPNLSDVKDDVANKYLTKEYSEEYLSYLNAGYPIDVLAAGTMYSDGKDFGATVTATQYIGDNKIKVTFDNLEGGSFNWIITIVKIDSDYRIAKVEVSNE